MILHAPTIYVIDDDASVRESMALLLHVAGHRVEAFASGEEFLAATLADEGCIVLDMNLGGMDGQQVLEVLAVRGSQLPAVVLTAYGDVPMAVRAVRAGAMDLIPKSLPPEQLLARLEELLHLSAGERKERGAANALRTMVASLTGREREVLALAAGGLDTRQTAERLGISPRTVEVHRSHIARKCGAENLGDLFRLAARHGVVLPAE